MPRIITIVVVYTALDGTYPFVSGDSCLVHSQEELQETCRRLSDRYLRDGLKIHNTLFVEISDAMILAAAKGLQENGS
jgi:hypothetical protein